MMLYCSLFKNLYLSINQNKTFPFFPLKVLDFAGCFLYNIPELSG